MAPKSIYSKNRCCKQFVWGRGGGWLRGEGGKTLAVLQSINFPVLFNGIEIALDSQGMSVAPILVVLIVQALHYSSVRESYNEGTLVLT